MPGFLQKRGGYRSLRAYQVTEIVYDITFHFTERYLRHGDRTVDQMVQAARSGKQNIAEGSRASMTSRETEIRLTNVAKASLEELLVDYEDYLRVRGLAQWSDDNPRLAKMRQFVLTDDFKKGYSALLPRLGDEELANLALTLIHQASFLLERLIDRQQQQFEANGGIKEQMYRARVAYRDRAAKADDKDDKDDKK